MRKRQGKRYKRRHAKKQNGCIEIPIEVIGEPACSDCDTIDAFLHDLGYDHSPPSCPRCGAHQLMQLIRNSDNVYWLQCDTSKPLVGTAEILIGYQRGSCYAIFNICANCGLAVKANTMSGNAIPSICYFGGKEWVLCTRRLKDGGANHWYRMNRVLDVELPNCPHCGAYQWMQLWLGPDGTDWRSLRELKPLISISESYIKHLRRSSDVIYDKCGNCELVVS